MTIAFSYVWIFIILRINRKLQISQRNNKEKIDLIFVKDLPLKLKQNILTYFL